MGDAKQAVEWTKKAVDQSPRDADAWANLATAYLVQGMLSEAKDAIDEAVMLRPDNAAFLQTKATILISMGRHGDAISNYRKALDISPEDARLISNYLLTLNYLSEDPVWIRKEHCRRVAILDKTAVSRSFSTGGVKIRIGYVSSDFREHSIAYFIEPLLQRHNREKFEVYCYSNCHKEDSVTRVLKKYPGVWRDISGISDDAAVGMITRDGIDILVDLNGHTAGNRLGIFVRRATPVQVTWLGYPNTTGFSCMDYRLSDRIADPMQDDDGYSESVLHIDDCFLCYRPDETMPDVAPPPCLENGYITFGSFNNYAKLSDQAVEAWSNILRCSSDARLLIKNPSLTDRSVREACLNRFAVHGIRAERLVLLGHARTRREHLEMYGLVDIALDTFPYNGTTTTCEALWMGVPVVALSGDRHAARVGASILAAAGCAEWVAGDLAEYQKTALLLAEDVEKLVDLRRNLRLRLSRSTLCNQNEFVRKVEKIFERIVNH